MYTNADFDTWGISQGSIVNIFNSMSRGGLMKISRKLKLKIDPDMMRSIRSIGPWRSKRATFLAHSAGSSPIIMRDPSSGATGSKLKTARVIFKKINISTPTLSDSDDMRLWR